MAQSAGVTALLLCSMAFGGARAEPPLTAVFDSSNLPYSSEQGESHGLNVEIARLIAEAADVDLEIRWIDSERDGLLSQLLAELDPADLVFGVPIEPKIVEDEKRIGGDVAYSLPFVSARFVMVTRQDMPDLRNFRAAGLKPIGVQAATVASTRLWDEGYVREMMPSQEHVLTALAAGDIDYAVLWNNVGWLIEQNNAWRETLKIQDAAPETYGFSWDFAVALRLEDRALLGRVNKAIERLAKENVFVPVFEKYHVPYYKPKKHEELQTQ
jgi:ABC-type amino acid transport substrate-binding protein